MVKALAFHAGPTTGSSLIHFSAHLPHLSPLIKTNLCKYEIYQAPTTVQIKCYAAGPIYRFINLWKVKLMEGLWPVHCQNMTKILS